MERARRARLSCNSDEITPIRGLFWYDRGMKIEELGFLDEMEGEMREEVLEYVRGERKEFSMVPEVSGTEFQRAVLEAMMRIPRGEVRSYGEVASMAGYPRASRAVGSVCRGNKYPIIIPCHRVVGSGGIGGYAFGLEMKRELLRQEGVIY